MRVLSVRNAWRSLLRRDNEAAPSDWERPAPGPAAYRLDVMAALLWCAVGVLSWYLTDQASDADERVVWWQALVCFAVITLPLATRRRFPLTSLLLVSAAFLVIGLVVPLIGLQIVYQAAYFASLYSAAAWAKESRAFWVCAALVLGVMFTWVILNLTLASSVERLLRNLPEQHGPVPPLLSMSLYSLAMNVAFFGGALYFGRRARAGAWQRETLEVQAEQLRVQSQELARRAVVDERLRIARELHDVVAHHISAVGVQAAAARRTQAKSPDTSARLLGQIEDSSRQALAETRALLGVLRTDTSTGSGPDERGERSPEPGLGDLEGLLDRSAQAGVSVTLSRVEEPGLTLDAVPRSLGLSLYRVVQEALSNVRRHSTATSATVVLRTGAPAGDAAGEAWVEAEVLDNGRPRRGTSGGGFGERGIRERAALHHGEAEIGPRTAGGPGGGYRVRVRFPLQRPTAGGRAGDAGGGQAVGAQAGGGQAVRAVESERQAPTPPEAIHPQRQAKQA
ncbi:MAG: histidine kinase [Arthrobacter sp.]|jgi:signal transduction histidine kinase|nr:histidine kinase [Arthrobacter sp.]